MDHDPPCLLAETRIAQLLPQRGVALRDRCGGGRLEGQQRSKRARPEPLEGGRTRRTAQRKVLSSQNCSKECMQKQNEILYRDSLCFVFWNSKNNQMC